MDEGCASGGAARLGKIGCLEERPMRDTKHKTAGPDFANEAQERMTARGNEAKASIWNKLIRGEGRGKREEAGMKPSRKNHPATLKENKLTLTTQPKKFAIKRKRRSFAPGFVPVTATIPRSVAQLGHPEKQWSNPNPPVLPRSILKTNGTEPLNSLEPPVIRRLFTRQRSQASEACEGGDVRQRKAAKTSCENDVVKHMATSSG